MPERTTLCIAINKSGSTLKSSESFLRAHIERLPFKTLALIGNPGIRRQHGDDGSYIQSRFAAARALRWGLDRSGLRSLASQDCAALARYLRANAVDVVMAEYGPSAIDVADACRQISMPLVTHFHGWDAYVLASQPEARSRYQALFEQSAAIIAVSRHMRRHLLNLGAPADRTVWNPCGAEPDPTPGDPASAPPVFLSVGRPAPKKAVVVVLLAFAQVLKVAPSARLDLIGGHADQVATQLTRALGIQHAVTFHGPKPHAEVLQMMRSARCYVHPSVTAPDGDMEGTPVSVLEAMAAGLPVVSTRHGGVLDVLDGTGAGVLVDEFDVDATAAAMIEYARDPVRARTDGLGGRRQLEERWSMDRSLARLANVIDAARKRDRTTLAALAQDLK